MPGREVEEEADEGVVGEGVAASGAASADSVPERRTRRGGVPSLHARVFVRSSLAAEEGLTRFKFDW